MDIDAKLNSSSQCASAWAPAAVLTPGWRVSLLGCLLVCAPAIARAPGGPAVWQVAQALPTAGAVAPADSALPWVDAEVRRVDAATGRVSLRHAPIPNLDMAAMTMVFRVANPDWLQTLKEGDKVRIQVEKVQGAYIVQKLEPMR